MKKEVAHYPLTLASGATVSLSSELLRAPEILMKPELIDMESTGFSETSYNFIMKCDVDIRKDLYANVI